MCAFCMSHQTCAEFRAAEQTKVCTAPSVRLHERRKPQGLFLERRGVLLRCVLERLQHRSNHSPHFVKHPPNYENTLGRILPKSSLPFTTYSELGGSKIKSMSNGGCISKSKAKAREGVTARAGARDVAEAGAKVSAGARARAGARRAQPLKSGSRDKNAS